MTPIWIFPAYPLLIVGPFAGTLAQKLVAISSTKALSIIIGGYVLQGIGFLVSLMIYSSFIYRLMTKKLPRESLRPGMFISVGPSGFTIAGIITMARSLPQAVLASTTDNASSGFMGISDAELAAKISVVAANWMGLWLWGLALWFFFISIGAHYTAFFGEKGSRIAFSMTWYSFIFPNTALTTATFAIAESALGGNKGVRVVGYILTIGLLVLWFVVVACMIRALVKKQILWPQMQEDRNEGGWKRDLESEKKWEERKDHEADASGAFGHALGRRVSARMRMMTKGSGAAAHGAGQRYGSKGGQDDSSPDVVLPPPAGHALMK